MAIKCDITGASPKRGRKIHRRGLAKKKGGIGMHVTKTTLRWHTPNLKTKRVWVPELKKFVVVKATGSRLQDCCQERRLQDAEQGWSRLPSAGLLNGRTPTIPRKYMAYSVVSKNLARPTICTPVCKS